jgi:hypothetical protein
MPLHVVVSRWQYTLTGSLSSGKFERRDRKMVDNDQLFIERRPQGDYAIRRPNSERGPVMFCPRRRKPSNGQGK